MSSVAGISSSLDDQSPTTPSATPTKRQQFEQEFQQLGQDLQSGNLTAATADFGALSKLTPQNSTGGISTSFSSSPAGQAFNQLSQDLQSGNLTAAQQDYSSIQTDIQNRVSSERGGHHHHHGGGGTEASSLSQAFQALGTSLQSGNLTSAQQAYATLQQDLPQFAQSSTAQTTASSQSTSTGVSARA
jgi:outer membrane protein assembly factor BamD (BamD/ComL family)